MDKVGEKYQCFIIANTGIIYQIALRKKQTNKLVKRFLTSGKQKKLNIGNILNKNMLKMINILSSFSLI